MRGCVYYAPSHIVKQVLKCHIHAMNALQRSDG